MTEPLVAVRNLRVGFGRGRDHRTVIHGLDLTVPAGGAVAIVGESGSGKSVTARTLLGLTGAGATVAADELTFAGESLLRLSERRWRAIRGAQIGLVLQDALVSLDPLRPVGKEISESLRLHKFGNAAQRHERVIEMLEAAGVPEPEFRARQRSGELSGGLRQRALIASGLALRPQLVIADEPTTSLDAVVQIQVLDLLASVRERGAAVLLISHDLGVVSRVADEVVVMHDGVIVESGPTAEVLSHPREDYTKALLAAVPSGKSRGTRLSLSPRPAGVAQQLERRKLERRDVVVMEAHDLVKIYRGPDGVERRVVDGVSLKLRAGETLGVVGQSGSGKTTLGRMLLGVLGPDGGEVTLQREPWSALTDRERRPNRRKVGTVNQDALGSFDPRHRVGQVIADALPRGGTREQRNARVLDLLRHVGLGEENLERRPLLLSGGQRQRVAIAKALAADPEILVLDEPVSSLDASVQAQVLDLLTDLQDEFGTTYVFISHDFGVIEHLCDRVIVMRDGLVVEEGDINDVFTAPEHEYTKELLSAVPRLTTIEEGAR